MKTKKRIRAVVSLLLAAVLLLGLAACGKKNQNSGAVENGRLQKKATIGILQYDSLEQYDISREGFLAGLSDEGLTEGTDYEIVRRNAEGNPAKNKSMAKELVDAQVDVLVAISQPSAEACVAAAEGTDIPVVFTDVPASAAAELPIVNVTGQSVGFSEKKQLELIHSLQTKAKTLGVIYSAGKADSLASAQRYSENAPSYKLEVVVKGIKANVSAEKAVEAFVEADVDCIAITANEELYAVLPDILKAADEAEIPVYGVDEEQVKKGCAAAAAIDYETIGHDAGSMVAWLLYGYATCATMPYQLSDDSVYYVNQQKLSSLGVSIPDSLEEKLQAVDA